MKGLAPGKSAREHILDHRCDDMRPEGRRIDLAHALDAAAGLELQEHKVPAAEARRRIADDEHLYAVEFHSMHLLTHEAMMRSAPFCATMSVGALVFAE